MKPVQTKDTISATTKLIDYVLTKNNSEIEKWLINLKKNAPPHQSDKIWIADNVMKIADKYGNSLLHYCATVGNSSCLAIFLDSIFPEVINFNGATPLHFCAQYGHYDCCLQLIEKGSVLNTATNFGITPLHYSSMNGHSRIVELLIKHGANINPLDNDAKSPIFYAAKNGKLDTMILLVGAGAITDLRSVDGKKWEMEAEENGYNAELFRKIIFQYHIKARLLSALQNIVVSGITKKKLQ